MKGSSAQLLAHNVLLDPAPLTFLEKLEVSARGSQRDKDAGHPRQKREGSAARAVSFAELAKTPSCPRRPGCFATSCGFIGALLTEILLFFQWYLLITVITQRYQSSAIRRAGR